MEDEIAAHDAEVNAAVTIQRAYRSFKGSSDGNAAYRPLPPRPARARSPAPPCQRFTSNQFELDNGADRLNKFEDGGYIFNDEAAQYPDDAFAAGRDEYAVRDEYNNTIDNGGTAAPTYDPDDEGMWTKNDAAGQPFLNGDVYDARGRRSAPLPPPSRPSASPRTRRRQQQQQQSNERGSYGGEDDHTHVDAMLTDEHGNSAAPLRQSRSTGGSMFDDRATEAAGAPLNNEPPVNEENLARALTNFVATQDLQVAVERHSLVRVVDKPVRGWYKVLILNPWDLNVVLGQGFAPSRIFSAVASLAHYRQEVNKLLGDLRDKGSMVSGAGRTAVVLGAAPGQAAWAIAKFAYESDNANKLSFQKGDHFAVKRKKFQWTEVDALDRDGSGEILASGWVMTRALELDGETVYRTANGWEKNAQTHSYL